MMQVVVFDGRLISDRASLDALLRRKLNLTLDISTELESLHDLLASLDLSFDLGLMFLYPEVMVDNLGTYGFKLLSTLRAVSRLNPRIRLFVRDQIMD